MGAARRAWARASGSSAASRAEDPSTAIDWRQSAKSQHLFVREREWEVAQSVWFWRDGSPGMDFRSGTLTKRDRASLLALALASALVRGGERVALFGAPDAPASSRAALRRMALALGGAAPTPSLPQDAQISRNAEFVWLSDFLSPLGALETTLRRFTQSGVSGTLVHIVDPAEEDFPYEGRTRFEAPGGDLRARRSAAPRRWRPPIARASRRMRRRWRRWPGALGWSYLAHRTDKAPQTALVALYAEMSGARR